MSVRAMSRRRFLGGLGVVGIGLLLPVDVANPVVRRARRILMGTQVAIVAQGAHPAETDFAIEAAFREMARLERLMTRYRDDSQVAMLQRAAGRHPVEVAPEVMAVLQQAHQVSMLSAGAFDITVGAYAGWDFNAGSAAMPSAPQLEQQHALVDYRDVELDVADQRAYLRRPGVRIDLGGIAKLPILKAGADVLRQHGITDAMIDGGGDVLTIGQLQGRPWRVGVRDPLNPGTLLGTLEMNTGVVASSGDYERFFMHAGRRYHHILDPRTGYPSDGVHGVTLTSASATGLSGLGAAIMVMGASKGKQLLAASSIEGLIAGADGQLWMSDGLPLNRPKSLI